MTNEEMVRQYTIFCKDKGLPLEGSISRNQSDINVLGDILSALHAKSFRAGVKQGYDEGYSYGYDAGQEESNDDDEDDDDPLGFKNKDQ